MNVLSSKLRIATFVGCAALSLIGCAFATLPAQALPLSGSDVSFLDKGGGTESYMPMSTRLTPGRHYARRAGLYTCGATNIHTQLNRQACGGNNKMQTYRN